MKTFFNDSVLKFVEACNRFSIRMMLVGNVAVNYYGHKKTGLEPGYILVRRKRDSNPRSREGQRFSRPPQSTTLPFLRRQK